MEIACSIHWHTLSMARTWPCSNENAIGGVCQNNRQMFEPLIIQGTFNEHTDQMACARVWGSHIELQAAASLLEMPVFLCACTIPHNLGIKGTSGTATSNSHQGN